MSKDLRYFLQMVKKAGPDYYVEVKKPIAVDLEVNVIQEKLAKEGRFPVVYCPEMKEAKLTCTKLCSNLFGSYEMLGMVLDIDPDTLKEAGKVEVQHECRRRQNSPKPVQWVSAAEAPVKEVVVKGKDVDLATLPIPHGSELDSGKYIGAGGTILKDADTGIPNVGVYRHEVKGKNKLGCQIGPIHHGSYIGRRYAELGKKMEAAIYLGHHPAVDLAAVSRVPLGESEFEIAGGFLGEPLRVVKGETVDLPVPADAEIVIEGIIDPSKMSTDGPYAEYSGYYGEKRPCYIIDVTCITMRKDAIFHHVDTAHREHNLWVGLPYEATVYDVIKRRVPTLKAVHGPVSGCCIYHYYISIAKRAMGEGMVAGLLAIGADVNSKLAIVVDEDIDVFNEAEVMWAVATRVAWDKQVTIIPKVTQGPIDPRCYSEEGLDYETEYQGELIAKVIIDATKPVKLPYSNRITPPKDLWESMKLEDYV